MIKGVLDRFEEQYAIVEIEGEMKVVRRCDIPDEAREGDALIFNQNKWTIDKQATDRRKQEINKLAEKLWQN